MIEVARPEQYVLHSLDNNAQVHFQRSLFAGQECQRTAGPSCELDNVEVMTTASKVTFWGFPLHPAGIASADAPLVRFPTTHQLSLIELRQGWRPLCNN